MLQIFVLFGAQKINVKGARFFLASFFLLVV